MNPLLRRLMAVYMAPAGEDGSVTDRGDDFSPTEPEAKAAPVVVAAADPLAEVEGEGEGEVEVDDKAPKGKDSRIPLSRHKDILAKERATRTELETRLAAYEKGSEVAAINENITEVEDSVLKMEKEYTQLLADGEIDKATALMSKIRQAERQITSANNEMRMQASIAQATERARYDVALERVEDAYNQLNPDSDDFDKEVLGDVVEMKLFYEKMRSMTPTQALQAAVKKVLGQSTGSQEKATTVAPRVSEKDVAAERRKEAVAKTLDATKRTPPSTSKVGLDSDKAGGALTANDVIKLSQKDFKALPDDVLSRMRGDEL